jgi:hypothetical protein
MAETGNQTVMMKRSFLEQEHARALRFTSLKGRT